MGTTQLKIDTQIDGTQATVTVDGKLTTLTAAELEAAVLGLPDEITDVAFDFADLEYIASAGLRVLVSTEKSMVARGGHAHLRNANEEVVEVFEMTGLAEVFDIA